MAWATVALQQDDVILSTSISARITEGALSDVCFTEDGCKTYFKPAGTFFSSMDIVSDFQYK